LSYIYILPLLRGIFNQGIATAFGLAMTKKNAPRNDKKNNKKAGQDSQFNLKLKKIDGIS